ncbi:hypothetical protein VUR80DRAFT_4206 [Thermomyces stellatus]
MLQPHRGLPIPRYQVLTNPTHRVPRKGYRGILQRALEATPERSDQFPGRSEGAARGEEARAYSREA